MLKYFQKSKKDGSTDEPSRETKQEASDPTADGKVITPSTSGQQEPVQSPSKLESSSIARPASAKGDQQHPVLSDADELFLLHVASEGEPPPLPPRPGSAQAQAITPTDDKRDAPDESSKVEGDGEADKDVEDQPDTENKTWKEKMNEWFKPQQDMALQRIYELNEARQAASHHRQRSKDRTQAADTLQAAAHSFKSRPRTPSPSHAAKADQKEEEQEEAKEVGTILERLNLSSINNRVVGISNDTQKLLEQFNQVLKDIVNGVPTAYDDLEHLLKDREGQLDKLYGGLPPWLQGLVKTVPVKVYAALAPQLAAAMTAQDEKISAQDEKDGKTKKKKKRFAIPSVKTMIGQKGMVAGMLRSIIGFLEARFPLLLTGTNVIVSMAVFILLFVFWYCHKRGKETRLAKASAVEEEGESGVDYDSLSDLEKNVGSAEKSRDMEHEPPEEAKMLTAGDDEDIEQNVDALMDQLGKPTEKVATR